MAAGILAQPVLICMHQLLTHSLLQETLGNSLPREGGLVTRNGEIALGPLPALTISCWEWKFFIYLFILNPRSVASDAGRSHRGITPLHLFGHLNVPCQNLIHRTPAFLMVFLMRRATDYHLPPRLRNPLCHPCYSVQFPLAFQKITFQPSSKTSPQGGYFSSSDTFQSPCWPRKLLCRSNTMD